MAKLDIENAKAILALFTLQGKQVKITGVDDSTRIGQLTKITTRNFCVVVGDTEHAGKWPVGIELDNEAGFFNSIRDLKRIESA